jgi:hypothetical protein
MYGQMSRCYANRIQFCTHASTVLGADPRDAKNWPTPFCVPLTYNHSKNIDGSFHKSGRVTFVSSFRTRMDAPTNPWDGLDTP